MRNQRELSLLVQLIYFGIPILRAQQTLGEEYTFILPAIAQLDKPSRQASFLIEYP
jgi:hypothetical protein